jgi:hypothetical protein
VKGRIERELDCAVPSINEAAELLVRYAQLMESYAKDPSCFTDPLMYATAGEALLTILAKIDHHRVRMSNAVRLAKQYRAAQN